MARRTRRLQIHRQRRRVRLLYSLFGYPRSCPMLQGRDQDYPLAARMRLGSSFPTASTDTESGTYRAKPYNPRKEKYRTYEDGRYGENPFHHPCRGYDQEDDTDNYPHRTVCTSNIATHNYLPGNNPIFSARRATCNYTGSMASCTLRIHRSLSQPRTWRKADTRMSDT